MQNHQLFQSHGSIDHPAFPMTTASSQVHGVGVKTSLPTTRVIVWTFALYGCFQGSFQILITLQYILQQFWDNPHLARLRLVISQS